MDLNTYQREAQSTDRVPSRQRNGGAGSDVVVPLLGLAGEAGELLSEYKKHLRDGDSHLLFRERVSEELGDLLWYVGNLAEKFDLKLEDIAQQNLRKTRDRWGPQDTSSLVFDADFEEHERLPRRFEVELSEVIVNGAKKIRMQVDGKQIGDDLTDNADDPDGYRFHDVFHLGYVAVLGWSPVIRKLLGRKRRSNARIDEVQDGGRAQVLDEGVAALVFDYAKEHRWLEGVDDLDYKLLRTVKGVTSLLEVRERSLGEWQRAILNGFEVWRQVLKCGGGKILVDQDARALKFLGPPAGEG
ncbi:nucleotide pyrophosphohydrolase [Stenotrophomonas maltophilia]|uniref:nucleoside triphosphate pyrophosphohydrolase family protein n=1 Tax=Stenotrophomonas TaxID=40323 RepID=UPI00131348C5|nr:nucleoside triphosphate pyrophosphohydrolase family protein [Stenotrophomonas maltophilia]MBA0224538.1 nucleotide pyrophosphohydrolase [Stenotrophomonas maltophilia]MBA0365775.1 nucleotide pyrophosphohydrolase [Stenotrophomonas maltophilia]MBA0405116.1 nucleotide pyrophosphohydrolase [Stenotrophomonas maltophilia]MCF3519870.1 nucleotide pyrophosphohydrolase [Stenotrophomonas maltophilia]